MSPKKLCGLISRQHISRVVFCSRYVYSHDLHIKESGEKPKASEQMHNHEVPRGALVDCLHQTMIVTLEYN